MKIIIGLGNPDLQYKKTRHNAGFLMLDKLKKYFINSGFNFSDFALDKKFNAQISQGKINSEKVLLVKPQTYMNNSGLSVEKITSFYKIDTANDLIIIYDDIDLPFLEVKTKGKSSGGHKGMQSIINSLNQDNLLRIRVGILGQKKELIKDTASYVLQNFNKQEEEKLDQIFSDIIPPIKDFLEK